MVHAIQWVRRNHCVVIVHKECRQPNLEKIHESKKRLGCSSGWELTFDSVQVCRADEGF